MKGEFDQNPKPSEGQREEGSQGQAARWLFSCGHLRDSVDLGGRRLLKKS